MKRFLLTICLLLTAVGFSGCSIDDNDDDNLYDVLIGRVWCGDLGFFQDGRVPLNSYVYFGADGFGYDELHFVDNDQYLDKLNIQWESNNNGSIWINYGKADFPRELRHAYIRHGVLVGDLHIDGQYYNRVELYMQ